MDPQVNPGVYEHHSESNLSEDPNVINGAQQAITHEEQQQQMHQEGDVNKPEDGTETPEKPQYKTRRIETSKGRPLYIVNDYTYEVEKRKKDGSIYGRCDRNRAKGCKGRVILTDKDDVITILKMGKHPHNHDPPTTKTILRESVAKMKKRVREEPDKAVQGIFASALIAEASLAANADISQLPTYNKVRSTLYRVRTINKKVRKSFSSSLSFMGEGEKTYLSQYVKLRSSLASKLDFAHMSK